MSKSLGNMVFIWQLLDKCPADAVRLCLLTHHYRQSWNFDARRLVSTRRLARTLARSLADCEEARGDEVEQWAGPFLSAMSDDLNTPRAIAELAKLAEGSEPSARRAARTLGGRVLGLTLEA